jgi:hypothetical protein
MHLYVNAVRSKGVENPQRRMLVSTSASRVDTISRQIRYLREVTDLERKQFVSETRAFRMFLAPYSGGRSSCRLHLQRPGNGAWDREVGHSDRSDTLEGGMWRLVPIHS